MRDHPVVDRLLRFGYEDGGMTCDICGDYVGTFYYEIDGEILCDCCVDKLYKKSVI